MKLTTKLRILNYLNSSGWWVSGNELEHQADEWQTKPSTISRRARELADDGRIARTIIHGTVQYRIINKPSMSADEANAFLKSLEKEKVQGALQV